MQRVVFLVDGFNLYHSLREASRDLGGAGTRWLDLSRLCRSYLPEAGRTARLERIHYFSALATHREALDPGVTRRHRAYISCIESTGVVVELGRFKEKWLTCPDCGSRIKRHEEKETDVAIATRLLESFATDRCDVAVLISGDGDLTPAVRAVRERFGAASVLVGFPYRRGSWDLRGAAHRCFKIRRDRYLECQFDPTVTLEDGTRVARPVGW